MMNRSVLELNEQVNQKVASTEKKNQKFTFVFSDPIRNNFRKRAGSDRIHSYTDEHLVA